MSKNQSTKPLQEQDDSNLDPELAYGNQDKAQKYPFPKKWLENENVVIIRQEKLVDIDGKVQNINHSMPIQALARPLFNRLSQKNKAGKDGFSDIGIDATVLHDALKVDTAEPAAAVQDAK